MSEVQTMEKPAATKQPKMRFRLLHGCHVDTDPTTVGKVDQLGRPVPPSDKIYFQGDIIETDVNLTEQIDHNCPTLPQKKFERIYGDPIGDLAKQLEVRAADPAPAAPVETQWTVELLGKKSVRELQQIVVKNKIPNPHRLDNKEDLIRLIMGGAK